MAEHIETAEMDLDQVVAELKASGKEARIVTFRESEGPESQLQAGEKVLAETEIVHVEDKMEDADMGERSATQRKVVVVKE